MDIIEHGRFNKFRFRGECPVCGCVFETTVTKGGNNLACEIGAEIVTAYPACIPASVIARCPDCDFPGIEMKEVKTHENH